MLPSWQDWINPVLRSRFFPFPQLAVWAVIAVCVIATLKPVVVIEKQQVAAPCVAKESAIRPLHIN